MTSKNVDRIDWEEDCFVGCAQDRPVVGDRDGIDVVLASEIDEVFAAGVARDEKWA